MRNIVLIKKHLLITAILGLAYSSFLLFVFFFVTSYPPFFQYIFRVLNFVPVIFIAYSIYLLTKCKTTYNGDSKEKEIFRITKVGLVLFLVGSIIRLSTILQSKVLLYLMVNAGISVSITPLYGLVLRTMNLSAYALIIVASILCIVQASKISQEM